MNKSYITLVQSVVQSHGEDVKNVDESLCLPKTLISKGIEDWLRNEDRSMFYLDRLYDRIFEYNNRCQLFERLESIGQFDENEMPLNTSADLEAFLIDCINSLVDVEIEMECESIKCSGYQQEYSIVRAKYVKYNELV